MIFHYVSEPVLIRIGFEAILLSIKITIFFKPIVFLTDRKAKEFFRVLFTKDIVLNVIWILLKLLTNKNNWWSGTIFFCRDMATTKTWCFQQKVPYWTLMTPFPALLFSKQNDNNGEGCFFIYLFITLCQCIIILSTG